MEIHRTKHFQQWIEKMYVECSCRYSAISPEEALAKWKDEYYNDANMLSFIINSTFPNTKRVEDEYHFITNDNQIHTDIVSKETFNSGITTLRIDPKKFSALLFFSNPYFHHGHVEKETGKTLCYGGYNEFGSSLCKIGLSGALMDWYNFSRVSSHDTRLVEA
jgi:hypothetical protein